ncbi:conserved hypothetical protein [Serratia proteamaculans]|uniref:hypothetical protein n=1 Tax=Serratia proteamaculans TaxID=28151 RepID=UPI0009F7F739|nr:hypothetical protein [Serratia proteamaculans]SMB57127.1 conserved hypothetical protein [Serratia proteamaculans]
MRLQDLVVDIAQKQMKKQIDQLRNSQPSGMVSKDAGNIQLTIINVRTIKHDTFIDAYTSSADLEMTLSEKMHSIPITYNIQKMDDSYGQFYINAFGL